MAFQLPISDEQVAMIDVRHGGSSQIEALKEVAASISKYGGCGAAVYAGTEDDKLLTYAQWQSLEAGERWATDHSSDLAPIGTADRWASRLYRLASTANRGVIDLSGPNATIAHTGLFAMLDPSKTEAMLVLAKDAAQAAVDHTPALLTANFHVSFDLERVVNVGFWADEASFHKLAADPPFKNKYWDGLADNEPGFYRRVFVI